MGNMQVVVGFFISGMTLSTIAKIFWNISTLQFLGLVAAVLAVSLLLCAIILGCFKKITIKESTFPGFKYVYFETQGTYNGAAGNLSPNFEGVENAITSGDPNVRFIAMYFDHPSMLQDESQMRVCWGLGFLNKEVEEKYKTVIEKLTSRGAAIRELPTFKYAHGNIQFHLVLSFIIANKKIYPPLFAYLKEHYPEQYYADNGVPFVHIPSMEEIMVGMPLGPNVEGFKITSIVPPKRNERWEQEKKNVKAKAE